MLTIFADVPEIDCTSADFTTVCEAVIITTEHIYKFKRKVANEMIRLEGKKYIGAFMMSHAISRHELPDIFKLSYFESEEYIKR